MSNSNPGGWLVILGDAYIGETLTARPNAVTDADGINYSTVSYQWLRDGDPIPGATGRTYDLSNADLGSEISLQYIYRDNGGTTEVVTSKPKPPVQAEAIVNDTPYVAPNRDTPDQPENPNNTEPMGWVVILGDAEVGETLTARPNAITDVDGIDYSSAKFQWFREDELIAGANDQTYVVSSADQGKRISVEYSYTDGGGTREIEYSDPKDTVPYVGGGNPGLGFTPVVPTAPTTPIEQPSAPQTPSVPSVPSVPQAPDGHINSGPVGNVFILGFPIEGTDLLARIDALYDRDNIIDGTGAYQWLRDGEPIAGATGRVYTITEDDRGAELSVQFSYTDEGGTRETVVSAPESAVPDPDADDRDRQQDNGEQPDAPSTAAPVEAVTTPEDDVVTIEQGMVAVDGLAGTDTAVLAGEQSDYTVALGPDGVTVTDRSANGVGTVELTNFEFLDFGTELDIFGGPMDLAAFGGYTSLSAEDFGGFIELYIAYFNRAPDAIGLSFWGTAYANGMSLSEISGEFSDQPETLETYPADTTNLRFAADVYENVLGRLPDIEGLRFWTDALNDGSVSRGEFIYEVLQGVKAPAPADATQEFLDQKQADQAFLEAKTDIGTLFAVERGMSNVDDAAMVMAMFDGSAGSFDDAIEAVNTLYGAAQDPVNGEFLMPLVGVSDDSAIL